MSENIKTWDFENLHKLKNQKSFFLKLVEVEPTEDDSHFGISVEDLE